MRLICKISIALIVLRAGFYFCVTKAFKSDLPVILISNIKDSFLLVLIGILLINSKVRGYATKIVYTALIYIAIFSILMLYPLLPEPYRLEQFTAPILSAFNYLSLLAAMGLIIYYILFRKAI